MVCCFVPHFGTSSVSHILGGIAASENLGWTSLVARLTLMMSKAPYDPQEPRGRFAASSIIIGDDPVRHTRWGDSARFSNIAI